MGKGDRLQQIFWVTFAVGNLLALISMIVWFPAAGLDIFYFAHVRLVVIAGITVALSMVFSTIGFFRHDRNRVIWVVGLLQILQLIPAFCAIGVWPGGDDGAKIGWTGIVMPIMAVIAIFGFVVCGMSAASKRATPIPRK
jgi:hypothetical protein